jgi:hypothetical protein
MRQDGSGTELFQAPRAVAQSSVVNVHSGTIYLLMSQARAISLLSLIACLNLLKDKW